MNAGWALGILVSAVLGFACACQTGWLGGQPEAGQHEAAPRGDLREVLTCPSGWRYQRGQPSHWKYLMMKR